MITVLTCIYVCVYKIRASLVAQLVKNLPAMWEAQAQSLGKKDSPEKGNGYLLEYSWLGNPMEPQFSSVAQSCPTLCDPMNRSIPGLPVHHHLLEFTKTHVHRVCDAIQPSHPLSSPSPSAPNPSQHQSFPMSQFFASGGQSIGVSASASVLPVNIQS